MVASVFKGVMPFTFQIPHRVGGNRKRNQQSTNTDQKSIETVFSIAICRQKAIETVFSIAICRQWGDKWQLKTLFLSLFDLPSSIVLVIHAHSDLDL